MLQIAAAKIQKVPFFFFLLSFFLLPCTNFSLQVPHPVLTGLSWLIAFVATTALAFTKSRAQYRQKSFLRRVSFSLNYISDNTFKVTFFYFYVFSLPFSFLTDSLMYTCSRSLSLHTHALHSHTHTTLSLAHCLTTSPASLLVSNSFREGLGQYCDEKSNSDGNRGDCNEKSNERETLSSTSKRRCLVVPQSTSK
jgi:hypothetical protein